MGPLRLKHISSTPLTRHATDCHPSAPPMHFSVTYGANWRNLRWLTDWLTEEDFRLHVQNPGSWPVIERWILTVAGGEEVLERRAAGPQSGHGVAFTVEVLERAHGRHVQFADAVVTHVDVRQSLEHAEVVGLERRQHEPVHAQVELLHVSHLGHRLRVQLINLHHRRLIALRVRRNRGEMYIGHARLRVCLSVCRPLPYSHATARTRT